MLDYCEQDKQCRRDKLFSDFDQYTHSPENTGCRCCDVCKKHCTCGNCFVDVSDMICEFLCICYGYVIKTNNDVLINNFTLNNHRVPESKHCHFSFIHECT